MQSPCLKKKIKKVLVFKIMVRVLWFEIPKRKCFGIDDSCVILLIFILLSVLYFALLDKYRNYRNTSFGLYSFFLIQSTSKETRYHHWLYKYRYTCIYLPIFTFIISFSLLVLTDFTHFLPVLLICLSRYFLNKYEIHG